MKTFIDLPDELIAEAMIATSSKTIIEAIKKASSIVYNKKR